MSALEATQSPEVVVWNLKGPQANDFCRSVRAVALAASKDGARKVLTGIRIIADGTSIRMEACDSYRLYRLDHKMKQPAVTALIPAKFAVRHLPRHLAVTESLTLTFGDRLTIEVGDEAMTAKMIPGDYPNTDSLLSTAAPVGEGHEFAKSYNPAYLIDIYRAAHMVAEGSPVTVRAGLDAMKPTRFDVVRSDVTLTMVLMPVRTVA